MNNARINIISVLIALTACVMLGFNPGTIGIDYFKAKGVGDRVVLEWRSISEEGLKSYSIERKRENQTEFEELKVIDPKGNGSIYQFDDLGLYKTSSEKVNYRLKITGEGSSYYYMDATASYTSTTVRRTWGSIKAMFK
jgi:hypothetical protein